MLSGGLGEGGEVSLFPSWLYFVQIAWPWLAIRLGFPFHLPRNFPSFLLSCQWGLCVFRPPPGPQALWSSCGLSVEDSPRAVSPGTREAGAITGQSSGLSRAARRAGHTRGGWEGAADCGCAGRKASRGPVGIARPPGLQGHTARRSGCWEAGDTETAGGDLAGLPPTTPA